MPALDGYSDPEELLFQDQIIDMMIDMMQTDHKMLKT
jgi:hypothetical protein